MKNSIAIAVVCLGLCSPAKADLFSVSDFFDSDLNSVNTTTGASTLIGDAGSGHNRYNSLAINSQGNIFSVGNVSGSANPDRLVQFNTATGASSEVATVNLGVAVDIRGLSFSADDTLFATNQDKLYTINTSTGAGTLVGDMGIDMQSLAFANDGFLYGWDSDGFFNTEKGLVRINTSDASITDVSLVNDDLGLNMQGLGVGVDGKFYGATLTQLYEINLSDGSVTAIGANTLSDVRGLAGASLSAVPEPGTLFVLTVASLIGLVCFRQRIF